jgi:hypothetical protein
MFQMWMPSKPLRPASVTGSPMHVALALAPVVLALSQVRTRTLPCTTTSPCPDV